METSNLMKKTPSSHYTVKTVVIDYDAKSFVLYIPGYKPVELLFMEVESFMEEYDSKLYDYLLCKSTMTKKVLEAVDIGYDFIIGFIFRNYNIISLATLSRVR